MLFFNFLNSFNFPKEDGFLQVVVTDSVQMAEEDFPQCDVYYEDGRVVVDALRENKKSVFICNDEKAKEVNGGIERSVEEDFLILTDKIAFIDGVKAYFRYLPFNGGMLICLYGGAVKIHDGSEWRVLSRSGKGTRDGEKIYPVSCVDLLKSVYSTDEKTGYNMVKDGVSSCEVLFSTSAKTGTSKKFRSFRDEFTLLNDEKLKRRVTEYERKEKKDQLKQLEKSRAREENKKFEDAYKRKGLEKEKAKKDSVKKKKSLEKEEDSANAFLQAVMRAGYIRK